MARAVLPDDRRAAFLLAELRKELSNLGASPDEQIAYVESAGISYDEFGLEFDDVVGAAIGYELVTESGVAALRAIETAPSEISGQQNAALWMDTGLRIRRDWSEIRQFARDAVVELGEPRRG